MAGAADFLVTVVEKWECDDGVDLARAAPKEAERAVAQARGAAPTRAVRSCLEADRRLRLTADMALSTIRGGGREAEAARMVSRSMRMVFVRRQDLRQKLFVCWPVARDCRQRIRFAAGCRRLSSVRTPTPDSPTGGQWGAASLRPRYPLRRCQIITMTLSLVGALLDHRSAPTSFPLRLRIWRLVMLSLGYHG